MTLYKNGVALTPGSETAAGSGWGTGFYLGRYDSGSSSNLDGLLDNFRIWHRALSAADVIADYNAGSGLAYNSMSTSDKVSLVCAYDFASPGSGLVADSHGSNTLTNNNSVSYAAGIVSGTASADGDPVTTWQDQSGNARHLTAPTRAKRPTLKLAIQNGLPCVLFDGVDDYFDIPNFLAGRAEAEIFVVAKTGASGAGLWTMGHER
jgi:hypothetical protein